MAIKKKILKKTSKHISLKDTVFEEMTEAQKRGKRSKNKGATYERKIAKHFKNYYDVELTRTPQSGGFAKKTQKANDFRGDIVCVEEDKDITLHIECKNQKSVSMRKWIAQAESDCPSNKIPVVIYYLGQIVKNNKVVEEARGDYITLKLEDFLNLVPRNVIVTLKGVK